MSVVDIAAARMLRDDGGVAAMRAELAAAEALARETAAEAAISAELRNPLRAALNAALLRLAQGRSFDAGVGGVGTVGELAAREVGLGEHAERPGVNVLLLPAWDDAPAWLDVVPDYAELVCCTRALLGLLAVSPRDPAWFAWAAGEADALGGVGGARLRVHGTPLGWLRGDLAALRRWQDELLQRRLDIAAGLADGKGLDGDFALSEAAIAAITPDAVSMPPLPLPGAGRLWLAEPKRFPWGRLKAWGVAAVVADDDAHAAALWALWPRATRLAVELEVAV